MNAAEKRALAAVAETAARSREGIAFTFNAKRRARPNPKTVTLSWWSVKQGRHHVRRVPAHRVLDAASALRAAHNVSRINVDFGFEGAWEWSR